VQPKPAAPSKSSSATRCWARSLQWTPTQAEAAIYLAAMIDGEGCVDYRGGHSLRRILISNTESSIIDAILACCDALDLHTYVYEKTPAPPRKVSWEVNITGLRSLRRLAEVVPLRSEAKAAKLDVVLASYVRPPSDMRYSTSRAEARLRAAEALRLRREGLTWRAIGERLNFSEAAACRAAGRAAKAWGAEES